MECRVPTSTGLYSTDKPTLLVNFTDDVQGRNLKDRFLPTVPNEGSGGGGGAPKDTTTLIACMEKNGEREQLSEMDSVYCRKCKEHRAQFKTLSIWNTPEIFIVHLRRFGRESRNAPLTKIDSAVDPHGADGSLELDLGPFMSPGSEETHTKFDLFAVINHMGGTTGGHYTAFAKVTPPAGDQVQTADWYEFNDSRVTRQYENPLANARNQGAAYVLFYKKRRS